MWVAPVPATSLSLEEAWVEVRLCLEAPYIIVSGHAFIIQAGVEKQTRTTHAHHTTRHSHAAHGHVCHVHTAHGIHHARIRACHASTPAVGWHATAHAAHHAPAIKIAVETTIHVVERHAHVGCPHTAHGIVHSALEAATVVSAAHVHATAPVVVVATTAEAAAKVIGATEARGLTSAERTLGTTTGIIVTPSIVLGQGFVGIMWAMEIGGIRFLRILGAVYGVEVSF